MRIVKYLAEGEPKSQVGLLVGDAVQPLAVGDEALSAILNASSPEREVERLSIPGAETVPLSAVALLAPIDRHEVWAAGVTYERSKVAREGESQGAAVFYDLVYRAPRPELFFKATPNRVVGPGGAVRIRQDGKWNVPEPELGLVLSPDLTLVGYTIGNDMSSRDIEGENPLYLPQAKLHDRCCALGPCVTLASAIPDARNLGIALKIERAGGTAFEGRTSTSRLVRSFEDLISWLGRDNLFPDGVVLLTGTGVIPPDDFTLYPGDVISIAIEGIGTLANHVVQNVPPGP